MDPVSSREFLDIQASIECGFTLKRVHDMIKTYSFNTFFKKIKTTRSYGTGLSTTTSDEISCGSSTQKFSRANSKKEKHIDSSDETLIDLLNENDK